MCHFVLMIQFLWLIMSSQFCTWPDILTEYIWKIIIRSVSTSTSSTSTSSVSSEVSSEAFRAYYEYTLYLGDKEASARGILVLFMELVRDALQKRHPNQTFYVDHELKVLRFSSDAARIVASTGQERMDVVFSLEWRHN